MTRIAHEPAARSGQVVSDTAIAELRGQHRGDLIRPGDEAYDAARQVWNAMVDRSPALIARCTGTADVAAAVRFARATGLEIAVRGGGHSVAGHGTTEGGLVIDLSPMSGVRVDPDARRAWVQGGAQLGQMDHETQLHGLATTAGTVPNTGVGGLTLGGGYGYLARRHGLACDNVVGAEVVLASGDVVRADETRNADLFWGLRGGGGNFGIVTGFEFQLHPVPPTVSYGDTMWAVADGLAPLRALVDFAPHMPEDMFGIVAVNSVKPEWGIEGVAPGTHVVNMSWIYLGEADEGRRLADPLYPTPPLWQSVETTSYMGVQKLGEPAGVRGERRYWKGSFATGLTDAALEVVLSRGVVDGEEPDWAGELTVLGGAIGRVGENDTAFSGRDALIEFLTLARWTDPAADAFHLDGARRYFDRMQPHLVGSAYVNSMDGDDAGRVRDAYGAGKYERLLAVKRAYDPDNVFHLNQNIRPTA